MKISSQGDIPTSFLPSAVFVSSAGSALGSLQGWHWMWWYLVSQRRPQWSSAWFANPPQWHFLGQLCISGGICSVCSSNCKNCICFPPHTNISLIAFHPSPCITALVRQQQCLSGGPRFLPEGLYLQEFICGCLMHPRLSSFGRVLLVQRAAELEIVLSPCPGCSRSLKTWIVIASEGNGWRFLTLCFELSRDQAVVAAFCEDKHPVRPPDSPLSHCQVGWCTGSPHVS